MTAPLNVAPTCTAESTAGKRCTRRQRFDDRCWQHIPVELPPPVLTDDGAATVLTRCGTAFFVDATDYPGVARYKWNLDRYGYPRRTVLLEGRRPRTVSIQRHILGLVAGDPRVGDHIDGDPLNNRRANLRAVDRNTNAQNLRKRERPRGVKRAGQRWSAEAEVAGVYHYIGRFDTEAEAAEAAHRWRLANMPGYVDRAATRSAS